MGQGSEAITSFLKGARKEIGKLAEFAYERELDEQFEKWRKNEITTFNLSGHIHQFHNGIARDLSSLYEGRDNCIAVTHYYLGDYFQR